MGVAWKYWRWVRLDPAQGRIVRAIAPAQDFFHQQFGSVSDQEEVNDRTSQRHLVKLLRHGTDGQTRRLAEVCLRCFISNQIDWVCHDLAKRFGTLGGFDASELCALVLDDVGVEDLLNGCPDLANNSLASQILHAFDPNRSQLSTWCRQMTISQGDLSTFLKASGVYLESDWSILNSTRPEHLRRILQQVYHMSSQGMEQAVRLLESFQAVYRRDRLQRQQRQGKGGRCYPPTGEQLDRILAHLQAQGYSGPPPEAVMERLQAIAHFIRQSRRPQTIPLDHPNLPPLAQPSEDPTETEQAQFLQHYRQVFQVALEAAIAQVVEARVTYHQGRKPPKDRAFLLALRLLHCEGKAMGEIARQVHLKQQYQVSRLLELKALRADVRRLLLEQLGDRIRELATDYIDPEQLHCMDETLDAALEQEVERMIVAAERESTTAQSFQTTLFSQILCCYLDHKEKP